MSGMSDSSSAFLDRLRSRLDRAPATAADDAGAQSTEFPPLLVAAAVQHVFTLASLGGAPDAVMLRRLAAGSVPAPGFLDRQGRILSRALRRDILRGIGPERARAARAGLEPVPTPTQAMFDALLSGRPLQLARLTRDELLALREAEGWLEGLVALPFEAAEIDHAIARSEVWAPFSAVLADAFVGRDADLAALARFAGLRLGPDGEVSPTFPSPQRIALVEGVGGIGKTALIAHFLGRLARGDGTPRIPFAYLACDDPTLDIAETDLLQSLAARQILRQVQLAGPLSGEVTLRQVEAAHDEFQEWLRRQSGTIETATKRSSTSGSLDMRLGKIRAGAASVTAAFSVFADLASRAMSRDEGWHPPCLIVIDTFEEVQYRSAARLLPFWRLIDLLHDSSRSIRIVIAGRPPLTRPDLTADIIELSLRELSHEASLDLLSRESGLEDRNLDRLARQIGGNPLNLRLAARVISDEAPGRQGIKGLSTRRWGFLRVSEELIRGQLYRRVLDHIHDPRVRALAHPGMILRRITPEIIAEVLAEICEIEIAGSEDAAQLFEALASEHTLVRRADDQSLRYRDDVRRPVLALLASDQPALTRRAHEAALTYYSRQTDPVSAAEAIYHGLMLGSDPDTLDALWVDGAAPHLAGAVEEMPPEALVWLAGKMDIQLPDAAYHAAGIAQWERIIGPRALAVLQEAGSAEVLAMLSERHERSPQSPLISIEARCLISLGDHAAAQALLSGELEQTPVGGNPGRQAEFLWLLAKSQWESDDLPAARETLTELARVAGTLGSTVPLVQCMTAMLATSPAGAAEADLDADRAALADALARCTDAEILREADVIRRGFAHVDPPAAGRLTRCALASLSGLYELADGEDALRPDEANLQAIRQLAEAISGRAGTDWLGERIGRVLEGGTPSADIYREAFDILRRPLASAADGANDPAAAVAARIVWHLVQMETTTLATATLAGIDDYRATWEVETSYLAATA